MDEKLSRTAKILKEMLKYGDHPSMRSAVVGLMYEAYLAAQDRPYRDGQEPTPKEIVEICVRIILREKIEK